MDKRQGTARRTNNSSTMALLLGPILFTLLAFLYPTVLTYYALFALVSTLSPTPFLVWLELEY